MVKDRQKRMAQTLGCLVASMTTCAILLHWGQPKSDRATTPAEVELIAGSIKQSWQYIRIDAARMDDSMDRQTHFFVDREGRCSWTRTWDAQAPLGRKGVVRIALQPSPDSNEITHAQVERTRWLTAILRETCSIPNDSNHVVWDDTLAVPRVAARKAAVAGQRPSVGQVSLAGSR